MDKILIEIDGVAITEREYLLLDYIDRYMHDKENNPIGLPPTTREALEELNQHLPKRKGNKPALSGQIQIVRLVHSLREKGLLHNVNERLFRQRNMAMTDKGKQTRKKIAGK